MEIRGFQGLTLIDYPGELASIVFTGGCNFRCPYCQNPALVNDLDKILQIPAEEILYDLKDRRKLIEGLVITGGEPTISSELLGFLQNVKTLKLKVKLDTNGSNPNLLEDIINKGLVDFISMDYKAPLFKYSSACGVNLSENTLNNIKKSAELIINSSIKHEFRLTLHPQLHTLDDVLQIAEDIKGAQCFAIQQFRPIICLDKSFEETTGYPKSTVEAILPDLKSIIPNTILRGF